MSKPVKHYGSWRIRWIDELGRRHSAVLDDHKAALLLLRQKELEADERKRGLRDPAPTEKTFEDIVKYWERERMPLKRSGDDDKSILKHLRSGFGRMKLSDFAGWVMAVDRYRASKMHLNVKTVHNHLTLLGSLLRLAHELGWMPRLTKIKKPRVRLISQDFCFLRTTDELRRFLAAAKDEGEQTSVLYATAVYTGAREGELAALEWADIDFENRLIAIQRSFDGPTKADDVRHVPILDPLLPVLRDWRLRAPGRRVFTNRGGRMYQPSARVFQEALHRVLRAAGFPKVTRNGRERPYIRFHDLRHTFASHWVMGGGDLFKLQKILGHKTVQMTMRYAHLQPAAFRDDYRRLGPGAVTATVTPMEGAKAS